MTHYDYNASKMISLQGHPFYALIMAAMRQADTSNLTKLRLAFPFVWQELEARYNAPGGVLPHEVQDVPLPPIEPQHEDAVHEAETLNREGREPGGEI